MLDTSLGNDNRDVSRLMTELAAAKTRVAELERDATKATVDLTTEDTTAHDAMTAFFDKEGKVTNLASQVDEVVRNPVVDAMIPVDRIPIPTGRGAIFRSKSCPQNWGSKNLWEWTFRWMCRWFWWKRKCWISNGATASS